MKYKEYSNEFWQQIEQSIELALKNDPHPVAAFDADGTLWDIDLGEAFFQYQIDKNLVPMPPNTWDYYHELKKKNDDPREAYLWLAQINDGIALETVRDWAQKSFDLNQPIPIFAEQKKLIDLLLSKNIEVYVVTASVKWAVEPGAKALGIDFDHVIGVETESPSGIINTQQKGIITYRQGKSEALLEKTNGKKPFLCSGNTMGDFHLLQTASSLSLAVSAASREEALFKTEMELQKNAENLQWLAHRFV